MNRVACELLEPSADHLLMEYDGIPFTGVAVEYAPNRAVLAEVPYVNGQRSGCATEWTESGQILREQHFAFNSLHGKSREWFENGALRSEGDYEIAICKNKKEWDEMGNIVNEFHLKESDPQFKTLTLLRNTYKSCLLYTSPSPRD